MLQGQLYASAVCVLVCIRPAVAVQSTPPRLATQCVDLGSDQTTASTEADVKQWLDRHEGFGVQMCGDGDTRVYYLLSPVRKGHFDTCVYSRTPLGSRLGRTFVELASSQSTAYAVRLMAPLGARCPKFGDDAYIAVDEGISEGVFLEVMKWWSQWSTSWKSENSMYHGPVGEGSRNFNAHAASVRSLAGCRMRAIRATRIGEDVALGASYRLEVGDETRSFLVTVDRAKNGWRVLQVDAIHR
jgi:hypothetical protein